MSAGAAVSRYLPPVDTVALAISRGSGCARPRGQTPAPSGEDALARAAVDGPARLGRHEPLSAAHRDVVPHRNPRAGVLALPPAPVRASSIGVVDAAGQPRVDRGDESDVVERGTTQRRCALVLRTPLNLARSSSCVRPAARWSSTSESESSPNGRRAGVRRSRPAWRNPAAQLPSRDRRSHPEHVRRASVRAAPRARSGG